MQLSIPLFLSADEKYAPFVTTTLISIMEHTSSPIDCYILDGGISNQSKTKIRLLEKQFSNLNINFLTIDTNKYFKNFPNLGHYSLNMYSRFLIPQLKPNINKAIYSDVDVIFNDDIKKIWEIDLEKYGLAAPIEECGEPFSIADRMNHELRKKNFNINNSHLYFQSGNLIIDCNYWRKHKIFEKLYKTILQYGKRLQCPDLDALNIVFADNYKILPYRFSVCTHRFNNNLKYPEIKNEINNACLIHYSSANKPWMDKSVPYAELFWSYVNKSPFSNNIKKIYYLHKLKPHIEKNGLIKKYCLFALPVLTKNKLTKKIYIAGICINPNLNLKKHIIKALTFPIFVRSYRKKLQTLLMDFSISGILNFFTFKNAKVKENTVLIAEVNACHGEVIPGLVRYLQKLGYNVDVLLREEIIKEKLFAMTELHPNIYACSKAFIKKTLKLKKIQQYEFIVLNSSRYFFTDDYSVILSLKDVLGFWPKGKQKTLIVEHDQNNIALFKTEGMARNNQLITLGKFTYGTMVNSHYFGNFLQKSKNKITTFVVVGGINPEQKNHKLLLTAISQLIKQGENFKVVVIGNGKLKNITEDISKYVEVRGRLNFPKMSIAIADADYLLTLLDPKNKDHYRYITTGVTGPAQLAYGFAKIPLIDSHFADFYGFTNDNSIIYNDDLASAMLKAIRMPSDEYNIKRCNLLKLAHNIEQQSIKNIKEIIND